MGVDDESSADDNSIYVYSVVASVPVTGICFTTICFMKKMPNFIKSRVFVVDDVNYLAIILYFFQITDMYSDGLFTFQLNQYYVAADRHKVVAGAVEDRDDGTKATLYILFV